MTTAIQYKQDRINQFLAAFQAGVDAWIEAGKILVELVDEDPHIYNYIQDQCPAMTPDILGKFESIGRGIILPTLAMDTSPGSKHLQRLPLSVQERFAHEPIPVIVQSDDEDSTDCLLIKYQDLTPAQAKQVFRNGRLATEGEQRAWIEDYKLKNAKPRKHDDTPWKLTKNDLIVGDIHFTAKQLAGFLAQLTK
jgi:hypothetical protein